MYIKSDYTDT